MEGHNLKDPHGLGISPNVGLELKPYINQGVSSAVTSWLGSLVSFGDSQSIAPIASTINVHMFKLTPFFKCMTIKMATGE